MSYPLSFFIAETVKYEDLAADDMTLTASNMLDLFIPSYSRWYNVRLDFADWRVNTGLAKIPKVSSQLRSLSMTRDYWIREEMPFLSSLHSSSNLTSLTFVCRHSHFDPISVIPLSQITHLHLDTYFGASHFFSVLEDCRSLISCHLFVMPEDGISNVASPDRHIVHENLQKLELSVVVSLETILGRLTLPGLKHLKISMSKADLFIVPAITGQFWSQMHFVNFLTRSRCAIEELELYTTSIKPKELLVVLPMLSHALSHLTLSDETSYGATSVDEHVLSALTFDPEGVTPPLCPKLYSLKLWGCVMAQDGLVSEMIRSRWFLGPDAPVSRLTMALAMLRPEAHYKRDIAQLNEMNKRRVGIMVL